jgi:hypothetical protein
VGKYDLTKFKSLTHGMETAFEMPEPSWDRIQREGKKSSLFANIVNRSLTLEKQGGRRSSINYMHLISREKRELQYDPMTETGNLNKMGPGPGKYELCKSFVDESNKQNRFSFPKSVRHLTEDSKERRLPISYTSPDI